MLQNRLPLALRDGLIELPDEGRILVMGPTRDHDLSVLPKDRITIYSHLYPDVTHWQSRGYKADCTVPDEAFSVVIICAPRAKALAQSWIHIASTVTSGGLIILDGQKTDGMDSHLKALKKRCETLGSLSKAHGKLIWVTGAETSDWAAKETELPGGFITRPGVFSAEKIDKGSVALVDAMPPAINGRVADLGAGWGYLSRHILEREGVTSLDLIEADRIALDCAQANIDDPRVQFIWGDATSFQPEAPYDVVISNPPFHTSRAGDPELGRAFIRAASKMLKPSGRFVMVANRHLPYEDTLVTHFRVVEDLGGTPGFKLFMATKPHRAS